MSGLVLHPRYKVGDKVRLKFGSRSVGTVTHAQGTYSPHGHILYHIRVPMSSEPLDLLVREEEVEEA